MSHQYAPVAPLPTLKRLSASGLLGHYQLFIAPIVLENVQAYRDFAYINEYSPQLIILDNGVIELGYPLDPVDLYKAARISGASVIILPDTIDDGDYTARQTEHALEVFSRLRAAGTNTGFTARQLKLLGVVQGKTLEECLSCAKRQVEAGVDWLAVPRGLTPNLGSRVQLTVALAEAYGLPIHILGFTSNMKDDVAAATCHPLVRGIDGATPCWLEEEMPAQVPMGPMSKSLNLKWGRRPQDFWQQAHVPQELEHNVRTVRQWLTDATAARTAEERPAGHQDLLTPKS